MKIRETKKTIAGGLGSPDREVISTRVRVLGKNEAMPPDAVRVPDSTKAHDWKEKQ